MIRNEIGAGMGAYCVVMIVLACLHKTRALMSGSYSWHPIAVGLGLSRIQAKLSFVMLAVVELVIGLCAFVGPRIAALLFMGVAQLYLVLAFSVGDIRSGAASCECFGGLFDARGSGALLLRNMLFLSAGTLIAVTNASPFPLSLIGLGTMLMMFVATFMAGRLDLRLHWRRSSRIVDAPLVKQSAR